MNKSKHPISSASERAPQPGAAVSAAQLFRGANTVVIVHNGERYQLRITRNRKLILTK
jgi:hemin uptake protein HemP